MTIHPLSKPSEATIRADIIALLNTFPQQLHLPADATFNDIAALEPHLTQLSRHQIYALNDVVPRHIPPLDDFVLTLLSIAVVLDQGKTATCARYVDNLIQLTLHKIDHHIPIDKDQLSCTVTPQEYDPHFQALLFYAYSLEAYERKDFIAAAYHSATALNLIATIDSPTVAQKIDTLHIVIAHANALLNLHDTDAKNAALIITVRHFGPDASRIITTLGDTPLTRYLTAAAYNIAYRANKTIPHVRGYIDVLEPLADSHPLFTVPRLAYMYAADHNSIPLDESWEYALGTQHAINMLLHHITEDPTVLPTIIDHACSLGFKSAEHHFVRILREIAEPKNRTSFDPYSPAFLLFAHKAINFIQIRPLPAPLVMAFARHVGAPTSKTTEALFAALAAASDYLAADPVPPFPLEGYPYDMILNDTDLPINNVPAHILSKQPPAASAHPPKKIITEFIDGPEPSAPHPKKIITEFID